MIPIVAGILGGGAAGRPRARLVSRCLAYAAGLALVYSSLGLVAGLSGKLFGRVSSNRWVSFGMANLLLLAGLALLDVFPVLVPRNIAAWAARVGGDSPGGALAMGAASGLVAAPCGAPAFAAVLGFVATTRSAGLGFVYLLVFSLGMTALLIATGLIAGFASALPRSGVWTLWIKRVCGVILIGTAEFYLYRMGLVS
jgi:cytochrome c-type biogenesis protein